LTQGLNGKIQSITAFIIAFVFFVHGTSPTTIVPESPSLSRVIKPHTGL
jgi:hypothetical protein